MSAVVKQSGFLNEVRLSKMPKRYFWSKQRYILLEKVEYYSELMGCTYCIPRGFITDLASSPFILHWILPPDGKRYKYEAMLHDFLYRSSFIDISRKMADLVFKEALIAGGEILGWEKWMLYNGVFIFGGSSFRGRDK